MTELEIENKKLKEQIAWLELHLHNQNDLHSTYENALLKLLDKAGKDLNSIHTQRAMLIFSLFACLAVAINHFIIR